MNHGNDVPSYGLWSLVIINSAIFIIFALSFFKPKTRRDWRTFGGFSAFIVALFVEMYGFPLTIYLLSGWLTRKFPGANPLGHDFGHLWYTLLGFKGDPHSNPIHLASNLFIIAGFFLLSASWSVLYKAQRGGALATTGPYKYVRHPQYIGFITIMFGFLVQWPTLVTLVMFPILATVYIRLAKREEQEVRAEFGKRWDDYAARTPRFLPWPRPRVSPPTAWERDAHA
jgi:protein-S-isoprenylcysteine O-methyltransferase Ste14